MKHILVTGGAGYIGSHAVRHLLQAGYKVTILDSLINGHKESVPESVKLYEVCLSDRDALDAVFGENDFDAVMHFAAYIEAGISMKEPGSFLMNNVVCGINLLEAMMKYDVKMMIFSSTAAVYGNPVELPIKEDHPLFPVNHYGQTKLIFEKVLKMYSETYGLKYVALRYFNASGADESGEIGEHHDPETHLIPLVLQAALDKRDCINVFGTDYDTKDGTCIRDYIHVDDLAEAHVLALGRLFDTGLTEIYNLGNGHGFSVKDVIDAAKRITGKDIKLVYADRREGDPAVLIADSQKIKGELNWNPKYTSIESIVESAWNWHSKYPDGYKKQ